MALPDDVTTFTLTFGPYTDAAGEPVFSGMTGKIKPSFPQIRHVSSGAVVIDAAIPVTIDAFGVAEIELAHTDQEILSPVGFTYSVAWDVTSRKPSPGNKQFAVPASAGTEVDFDLLAPSPDVEGVVVPLTFGKSAYDLAVDNGYVGTEAEWLASLIDPEGLADPVMATVVGDTASATSTALRAAYVSQVASISGETAAATTARVNAALAAVNPFGARRKVKLVGDFTTSAPLVVPSRTVLDATDATITLAPGSNCNMVQNAAVGTVRRVLDAVTTAASATLTSATAAFVSGDVGKAITIQGAGASGVPLTTTISAVTNGTTATLGTTAGTSVTGQYAAIGTRDTDIAVIGGVWDRGANTGAAGNDITAHNMRFRHVDGLEVRDLSPRSTGGKYAVNPGDCTRVRVRGIDLAGFSSDGVHINGPARDVKIRDITATDMHDDLVSMTARDSTAIITDCAGDITDVLVDGASYATSSGPSSVVKVVAGRTTDNAASYAVRRLTCRNITGPNTGAPLIYVGDPSLGVFNDLLFEDVRSLGGATSGALLLHGGTIDRVTCRRFVSAPGDSYAISADTTVTRLTVLDASFEPTGASSYLVYVLGSGNVTSLIVNGVQAKPAAANAAIVRVNSPATVTRVQLANCHIDSTGFAGAVTVNATSGSTVTTVQISNLVAINVPYPLGVYNGTTSVSAHGVVGTGTTAWLLTQGAVAAVTVLGASGLTGTNDVLGINTGTTVRVKSLGIPLDIGTVGIAKNVGDMAMNTNGSRSCGVGPVGFDGTNWKNLITAATFTPA